MNIFEIRPDASDDWREYALCRNSEADYWFPVHTGRSAARTMAIKICGQCPVTAECLRFALDNNERHGIWGGTSEEDRKKLRSGRRLEPCGTPGGYQRHYRADEPPCDACREGYNAYRRGSVAYREHRRAVQ